MKEFIKLNKWKMKFAFGVTSAIFTTLVTGVFIYSSLNGQTPDLDLLITVILSASMGMPLFILIIGTLRGTWDLTKRKKAFSKKPFSELLKHGFIEQLKNEQNKWKFSEPCLVGKIDDYQILAEVETQNAPHIIRFQALTKIEAIGKDEVKRLNRKFSSEDIELDFQGVTKKISIKTSRVSSIDELLSELNQFVKMIKNEKFRPTNLT